MRSSCSTWNVPGQRSPVAGCWPPPPPLGTSTGAIEKPAPDAPVNVAVAASSRHGAGSRPSQSSRNWRSRSAACAHESRAGSSTVIRYGPAGTASVPIASSWRTWNVDGHADGEGACAAAGAAAASASTATTASTEPVRVSVLMPSPRACRSGRRRPELRHDQRGEREQVAVDDPLRAGRREPEVLLEVRDGEGDDRLVDEHHRAREDHRHEDETRSGSIRLEGGHILTIWRYCSVSTV